MGRKWIEEIKDGEQKHFYNLQWSGSGAEREKTSPKTAANLPPITEAGGESVTQVLLRSSTRLYGDNLESLPGGQGGDVLYQFLVVDFIFSALSVLCLHPHFGDGVHLDSGH